MAKVTLKPNAELDVLTQAELEESLSELRSGFSRPASTDRWIGSTKLDANGNTTVGSTPGAIKTFRVPVGYSFSLHRITFKSDGSTFAVPFTNAAGYIEIQRQGQMVDGITLNSPGFPLVFTAGSAQAPVYDNGDRVEILIVGGPANTPVAIYIQGTLEPLTVL